jgi:hypothetical protein
VFEKGERKKKKEKEFEKEFVWTQSGIELLKVVLRYLQACMRP